MTDKKEKIAVDPQADKISKAYNNFFRVAKEVHGKIYSKDGALWNTRVTRFQSAFIKSKNPMSWTDMVVKLYSLHYEKIIKPVIYLDEDGDKDLEDKWLRDTVDHEKKGKSKKKKKKWSPGNMTCKGLVLYFDEEHKSISLPLSEIYLDACNLAESKGEKNIRNASYPYQVLKAIYGLFALCVSELDSGHSAILKNFKSLDIFIKEILPDGEESAKDSGGFQGMMANLMKQFSGGDSGEGMPSGMGETTQKIEKIAQSMLSKVGNIPSDGSDGIDNVMDALGSTLGKDGEIRKLLSDSAKDVAKGVAKETQTLSDSIPKADITKKVGAAAQE